MIRRCVNACLLLRSSLSMYASRCSRHSLIAFAFGNDELWRCSIKLALGFEFGLGFVYYYTVVPVIRTLCASTTLKVRSHVNTSWKRLNSNAVGSIFHLFCLTGAIYTNSTPYSSWAKVKDRVWVLNCISPPSLKRFSNWFHRWCRTAESNKNLSVNLFQTFTQSRPLIQRRRVRAAWIGYGSLQF